MNTATARENWVGKVVDGRFPLRQWLGGSENSAVFLTELPGAGSQKAAIKLIPVDGQDQPVQIARWRATSKLSHPHLVRLFHSGSCEIEKMPLLYVVMEHAEEDLSQILPQRALTAEEVKELLPPLVEALSYVHGKGLLHGHLKPSNIMATGNQLKLASDSLHPPGEGGEHLAGHEVYDAPEAARGAMSPAADVWSLGVTLVEALSQRLPIEGRSEDPAIPPGMPEPFAKIAAQCLRRDPARRCSLESVRAQLGPVAIPEPAKIAKPAPSKKSRMMVMAAAIALLVLIGVWKWMPSQTRPLPTTEEASSPAAPSAPVPLQQTTPKSAEETPSTGTVKATVAERVMPTVSRRAQNTIHGKIKLRVRVKVDSNGAVSNARLESAGPSRYFANAALQAARRWRFKPAQVNGEEVPSEWILRFEFSRPAIDVVPTETKP